MQQRTLAAGTLLAGFGLFLAVGRGTAAPPQGEALITFVNGEPADADQVNANFSLLEARLAELAAEVEALSAQPALSAEQLELMSHMSLIELDDGQGGLVKTIEISGVNVRIVNGLGATNGLPADSDSVEPGPTVTNGLGNLIVGYNELGNPNGDNRSGSHNIVFGHGNSYASFGGLVGPHDSTISAPYATVSGGSRHRASGPFSSVSAGVANTASGQYAAVSAGRAGIAGGPESSVTGGNANRAAGLGTAVTGGSANLAQNDYDAIGGGTDNVASGGASTIIGGYLNRTNGFRAALLGGTQNVATGPESTIAGGRNNSTTGARSAVSGGQGRATSGEYDWRAGGLFEED